MMKVFYHHVLNICGESYWLFRMTISLIYDPDEALEKQISIVKHIIEKEAYNFINYSDK